MNTWQKAIFIFLLCYTAVHLGYSVVRYNIFSGLSSGDFNRVYAEVAEWKQSGAYPKGVSHPPFYYLVISSLDSLLGGRQNIAYFLYFLQFLMFPLAILLMVQAAPGGSPPTNLTEVGIATILTVNFQPFLETLAQHKVEGIEFLLICLAVAAFKKKRDLLCGTVVVLATNLKYLPGMLIVYFLLKREVRVLLGISGAGVVLLVVLWSAFGANTMMTAIQHPTDLLFAHKHEGTLAEASVEMQTLSGTINRWFARADPPSHFPDHPNPFLYYIQSENYMPVHHASVASGIALFLKMLFGGLWAYLIRKRWTSAQREEKWPFYVLEISLGLIMILVISQAARVHYGILLLPAFVMVGLLLFRHWEPFHLKEKVLFALAYSLSGMLIPGGLLNRLPPHPVWGQEYARMYLWLSLPFYGYMILGVCILLCYKRLHQPIRSAL